MSTRKFRAHKCGWLCGAAWGGGQWPHARLACGLRDCVCPEPASAEHRRTSNAASWTKVVSVLYVGGTWM